MSMSAVTFGLLLVSFTPFLISLAAKANQPKALCFVCGLMALLFSVEPHRALLPWTLGLAIAVIAVRERFRRA
jgi:hypothetical protein